MRTIPSAPRAHRIKECTASAGSCRWFVALLMAAGRVLAQGDAIDEDAMFSDTSSVIDSALVVNTAAVKQEMLEKKSVGISGSVTTAVTGTVTRDWFDNPSLDESRLGNVTVGNLLLDVRLLQSFKSFANAEVNYVPDSNKAAFSLKELFIDANISRQVYFRAGKQVLQWGRCYFWNPTDLINIERKSFLQKIGAREGTYGLRLHVPFGTAWNIYGFLDAQRAPRIDSLAGAAKVEFLAGGVEMGVSVWDKRGYKPVYGFDLSAQLLKVNVGAEIALYQGYRLKRLVFDGTLPSVAIEEKKWIPRVCLNINRSFGVLGVQDRLNLVAEAYYNHVGLTDKTITVPMPPSMPGMAPPADVERQQRLAMVGLLMANGIYQQNNLSKWYAAFFGSMGKFLMSDLTLTINAIANLNQGCVMTTTGISYTGLNDFSLGASVNGFIGPDNTEYTFWNDAMSVQITAGVTF